MNLLSLSELREKKKNCHKGTKAPSQAAGRDLGIELFNARRGGAELRGGLGGPS